MFFFFRLVIVFFAKGDILAKLLGAFLWKLGTVKQSSRLDEAGRNLSRCGETQLGWYHDELQGHWGCFYGKKVEEAGGVGEINGLFVGFHFLLLCRF